MLMGKIFFSKIKGGQGPGRIGGWKGRRGTEGGSSLRAKDGRNRGNLAQCLTFCNCKRTRGGSHEKKGQEPKIQGIVGVRRFRTPSPTPFVCVCKSAPLVMGPKHLPANQYTNTHIQQNLKANAMSFLTSKIRDDEGQNLFNVKYIAVTWQIFCCFFVTRRFYQKVIYLGLISMCGGLWL